MQLKIVLVGERRVGKTSLLERYLKNHFAEAYTGTLGGRVYPTDLEVGLEGEDIALAHIAFFDLMGEHSVRQVFAEPFFFGTQGVLAVCDVERPDTLHLIKDWMDVMTKIAGPVPVGIAFNKIDRADSMAIGPGETAWLRKEFPAAPMFLTSARTGQGVEDAFSTIVSLTVDAVLGKGRASRTGRLFRQRILLFIAGRGSLGSSKAELFSEFKAILPAQIMEELDNLVRLEALALDPSGTKTFVKAAEAHGTTRYWHTQMPVKTVTLSEDAYAALAALKREGESFSEVVRRLARTGRSLLEFAGAWKDFPSEKMDRYLAFLEAGDRLSRAKLARELRRGRK